MPVLLEQGLLKGVHVRLHRLLHGRLKLAVPVADGVVQLLREVRCRLLRHGVAEGNTAHGGGA